MDNNDINKQPEAVTATIIDDKQLVKNVKRQRNGKKRAIAPTGGLTLKEKIFVNKWLETKGNNIDAAMAVYDTKSRVTASAMGSRVLERPAVQEALTLKLNDLEDQVMTTLQKCMHIADKMLQDDDSATVKWAMNYTREVSKMYAGKLLPSATVQNTHQHLHIPAR